MVHSVCNLNGPIRVLAGRLLLLCKGLGVWAPALTVWVWEFPGGLELYLAA